MTDTFTTMQYSSVEQANTLHLPDLKVSTFLLSTEFSQEAATNDLAYPEHGV